MKKSFKRAVLRKTSQPDQEELVSGKLVQSEEDHSAESAAEHAAHVQQPPQPVHTAVERLQALENPVARQSAFQNLQSQYGNSYASQVARQLQHGEAHPESATIERSPGTTVVPESIKKLNLAQEAEDAAVQLWEKNPDVVFNSGLRTLKDQARAMSGNVLKEGPNWLDIYADKSMVAKLKEALNADWATIKKSKTAIADTMFAVFSANQSQAAGFSRHLRGLAFDMQPGSCKSADVKSLPNLNKFLTKEGGLTIWHAQFKGTGVTPVLGGTAPTTTPKTKETGKETTPSPTKEASGPAKAELTGAQQTLVLNSLRQGLSTGLEGYDLANQGFFALHPNMQGKEIGSVKDATAKAQYKAEYMYIYKTLIPKAQAQPKKSSTQAAEPGVTLDQISKYLQKEYPTLYSWFSDYLSWKTISSVAESLGKSLSDFYESVQKSVSTPAADNKSTTPSTTPKKSGGSAKTELPKDVGDAPAWRTGPLTAEMVSAISAAREAIPEVEVGKGGLNSVKYAGKENAGLMYTPGQSAEEKAFSKEKSGKQSDGTTKTAQDIVWEELASEGSSNSINTYDGQGMTWGRGFAAGGLLPDMLWRFFAEVPGSRAEFNSIGIDSDGSHIYTIDVGASKLIKGNDELHDLRNDRKISSFFIHMGQKHPKALVEAQFETVTKNRAGAANVPEWALELPRASLQFIGHASHWYSGAFAWSKWQGHTDDWSAILHRYVKLLPGRHMYRTKGTASGIVHEDQAISYAFGSHGSKSWKSLTEATLEAAVSVEDVETLDSGEYFKVGKTSYRRIKS